MALSDHERMWRGAAIAMSLIAAILTAVVFHVHDKRSALRSRPAASVSGKYLALSDKSKMELVNFMHKEENVVGVGAISISLFTNQRLSSFFESEIQGFTEAEEHYMKTRTTIPRVFTRDYYQNTRITEIINGNFECRLTKNTAIGGLYPADKFAPWVCSIAIPPAFDPSGDFVGYFNFFLKNPISDSEKARLAKEAVILSNNIYHRDIEGK